MTLLGSKTKTCSKHGEVEAKVISIMDGKEIIGSCPICAQEKANEEQSMEKRLRDERLRRRVEISQIPLRFKGKTLDDLKFSSNKQKSILKTAKEYLKAIQDPKLSGTSLILCGRPGTGKTHIGCAFVVGFALTDRVAKYITTSQLMRNVKSTYHKDAERTEDEVLTFYGTTVEFLVIDEVGVQFGTETEKLIFYEIINRRYENMLYTVLISNLTADELKGFIGERAFDRFKEDGGAILAFDWESYRK